MSTGNFKGNGEWGLPTIAYIDRPTEEEREDIRRDIAECKEVNPEDVENWEIELRLQDDEEEAAEYVRELIERYNDTVFRIKLESGYYEGFELIIEPKRELECFFDDRDYKDCWMVDLEDLEYATQFLLEEALDKRKTHYLERGPSWDLKAADFVSKAGWTAVQETIDGEYARLHQLITKLLTSVRGLKALGIAARFSSGETWYEEIQF